jgi:hypothetical protein
MKKVLNKLKEKKAGIVYFESGIVFVLIVMCIVLTMTVVSALFTKHKLDNFAEEVARAVEISGDTYAVTERVADLKYAYRINPSIDYSRTGRINLNESFKVELRYIVYLEISGVAKVPVNFVSVATGASEVYWKTEDYF